MMRAGGNASTSRYEQCKKEAGSSLWENNVRMQVNQRGLDPLLPEPHRYPGNHQAEHAAPRVSV